MDEFDRAFQMMAETIVRYTVREVMKAVAEEREECAKICDMADRIGYHSYQCAEQIRERGTDK
jgi:hypothetical protein